MPPADVCDKSPDFRYAYSYGYGYCYGYGYGYGHGYGYGYGYGGFHCSKFQVPSFKFRVREIDPPP